MGCFHHIGVYASSLTRGSGFGRLIGGALFPRATAENRAVPSAVGQSRLADSASRNKRQCACFRKKDPGQAVLIGPCSAALTASALRFSGTIQNIFLAAQRAGTVSVSAYEGTDSRFGK